MKKIYYAAHTYMIIGLISGLYYREITKLNDFHGDSQLGLVHTHLLALGMLFFLIVLPLESSSPCPRANSSTPSSGPTTRA